jgi:hypothetical protein
MLDSIFQFADAHGITLAGDPRSMSYMDMIDDCDLNGRLYIIDAAVAHRERTGREMSEDAWRLMLASDRIDEWRSRISEFAMTRIA